MPPELKRLSGPEVVSILRKFGFEVHSQKGSNAKVRRISGASQKQTLTIPLHDELDTGTLRAIIRQETRFIPEEELRPLFYSD
ncbi:MAG: type II toxin-antitoxin system HicA family toxin [Dehalococcoidia bacterium]